MKYIYEDGTSHEFNGFTYYGDNIESHLANFLIVAWWDGEPDLWVCNDLEIGMPELKRYYTIMDGPDAPMLQKVKVFAKTPVADKLLASFLKERLKADDSAELRRDVMHAFIQADDH